MNFVEEFLRDDRVYDTGLFYPPVCRDLEPNYQRVFNDSERNAFGVYVVDDTHVIAEVREVDIEGLSGMIPGWPSSVRGTAIIKNPWNSWKVKEWYGEKNAVILDKDSGIVFAGRNPEDQLVRLVRPVVAEYQDRFREEILRGTYDITLIPQSS